MNVRLCGRPSFAYGGSRTGAQKAGIGYERRVQHHLYTFHHGGGKASEFFIPGLWLRSGDRYVQCDGLFIDIKNLLITIAEIKIRHTSRAYWQCERYAPFVRGAFGEHFRYRSVEIARYIHSNEKFPMRWSVIYDYSEIGEALADKVFPVWRLEV